MGVFALRLGNDRYLPLLDLDRPVQVTRLFTTLADGQRKAIFHFHFRKRVGGDWQPVGRIEWDELPPSRAGEPTLELRLVPGRAGSLLLRLRERTLGEARSYRLRLPVVPPEVLSEATPELSRPKSAPEPSRPLRPPEVLPRIHSLPDSPAAARRKIRRRRVTIGLALAAVLLLAIGAVLVIQTIPSKETHTVEAPAASAAKAPQEPAPEVPAAPSVEPEGTAAAEGEPEAADGVSGATPREPAAQPSNAEPPLEAAAPPAKPAPGTKPAGEPEPLSYRVQWGDTLWQITEQYYGNPYLYSLLAGENAIVDPDLIIPGTELRLPPRIDDRDRKR